MYAVTPTLQGEKAMTVIERKEVRERAAAQSVRGVACYVIGEMPMLLITYFM